jgi:outer membrane receptor protein involved in Fe transport
MTITKLLGATALVGVLATLPTFAAAQTTPPCHDASGKVIPCDASAAQPAAADAGVDVVVTGSRIRRPDLESVVPIATIKGDDIYAQSNPNVGEVLNNLPQLRSTFAQQNPGLGIGIAGLNLLDLRGLGVSRTLVLVNGRRHVPSDIQNTASSVDINTIPTDLIDRVDIVTGGNSAVYGSDAIAGVVNFQLKDHFDGLQVRGGDSIPQYGAGGNRYISLVAGKNFADGRGNIAGAVEFTQQDRLFGSQVPWLRTVDGFTTNDADPSGSDGIPDTVFSHDIRSSTIARYGLIPIIQALNPAAPCGVGIPNGAGTRTNYSCDYIFDSTGALSPVTGTRVSTGPNGTYLGGNGDNGREDNLLSILPYNQRISANLIGHFKFSDAATFFFEGSYARVHTIGSNSGPAFDQGAGVTFADSRANFRLDNPFLSSAARATITNAILASGARPSLTSITALTATDLTNIANGSFRFPVARNLTDLGIRDEDALRETYRFVAGFRGDITSHLNYEISGNFGRTNERINILGNVNVQRLLLAFDAGIDPANPGAGIQCRSKFAGGSAGNPVADVDGAATLAADIAACVPYNPFGGADNSKARNYIVDNSGDHGHLTQWDITGFVSGDTGGFFNLPGGPVAVVLGAEYRRDNAMFKADPNIENGLTFLNSLQTFDPPTSEVKEGFAELNLPVLKDMPFFKSLSLSGAARVSHYSRATGTVWAWNFGGEWAPVSDIRFRANYGKSVRAPNYTETDAPLGQNFAPGFQDPCNSSRIGNGTPQRVANCQAALGAAINNADFQSLTSLTYSLEILSGSNPNLKAETSKSLTVGAVITPRWLPGFDVTVDYFDINVQNVIASATAQQIVNLCYDNGQFCNLFQRNTTGTTLATGEVPGQIIQGSLIQAGLNFASLKRRGIDVQVNYNHSIGPNTRLSVRGYYTHQLKNSNYTDPTRPTFETRILGQLGDPKDEAVFNADLTMGRFTIGYGAHYIGPMLTTAYANLYSINGNPPQNADIISITSYPSVLYHDLRFSAQIGSTSTNRKGFEWFFGIHNVADKHPPLGTAATGSGSAIYDIRGREFFSGFRATF